MLATKRRAIVALLFLCASASATRLWTRAELEAREPEPGLAARPELSDPSPRRYNYLERIRLMADFVARHQVDDSLSPDFGGIREAKHLPHIIETDNTQEAIWVWSRWFELTGRDDYRENIRRAWHYVLNFPAYWEHNGDPSVIWYAVWNCGLAFMAESRYRAAYGDTSFRAYADSCRGFYLQNPLADAGFLDRFVTAQSSGMAYAYALETGDETLRDSALARGARVKSWVEEDATGRLARAQWAMSGGTAFWGVVNTVGRADTAAGRYWVETYADSLPGFHPTGSWNCSHNIWLANAYRAAAEAGGDVGNWRMHQYLLDTLLTLDTDRDGGIPATWTDPPERDQTWISTYLHFMAMDVYTTPTFARDAAQLELVFPDRLLIAPDSAEVLVPLANVGLDDLTDVRTAVFGPGYHHQQTTPSMPFLGIDTLAFPQLALPSPGRYVLEAITSAPGDENPVNDTARAELRVYGVYTLTGTLTDSTTSDPVPAWVHAAIVGDTVIRDSCRTDREGRFSLQVIDTTVAITIWPDAPYYRRTWELEIAGDTTVAFVTPTAHVMVVNNDPAAAYRHYYTDALDAIGVTWTAWSRPDSGPPPWHVVPVLRGQTVVYYSGDADTGTVPGPDRDSLAARGEAGLNLLLTGQGVARELAGTGFLEGFCGVRYDSSLTTGFFVFGNRADSVGRGISAFATVGGDGANNQRSRDALSPLRNGASTLLVYDTLTGIGAGVRRTDFTSGNRVITLGFGFEAVNQPSSRPDYLDRAGLMAHLLSWFGIPVGVAGPTPAPVPARVLLARPNPFRTSVGFEAALPPGTNLLVHDVTGRQVARLVLEPLPYGATAEPGGPGSSVSWNADDLPAGVYFVSVERGGAPPIRTVRLR